ncbi:MAG: phage portal protein, partial [Firmicutes bacterium]|nr:phage portal protein [Bacillota bacterium]
EDSRNTILVIKNYDGEDLGEFRRNLAAYGAVKVRAVDGVEGDVQTLNISVDGENYKSIIELLKKTIVENGRGFDTKALREMSSPNQMNIQSMYADIDLDANGMEAEMQYSLAKVIRFISLYLFNTAQGNFIDEKVEIIFNRDVLINENEAIDGCVKSIGLISNESLLAQHPYVNDVAAELARLAKEKKAQSGRKKENENGNGNNRRTDAART